MFLIPRRHYKETVHILILIYTFKAGQRAGNNVNIIIKSCQQNNNRLLHHIITDDQNGFHSTKNK
jgi:hypothetical protein